MYCEEDEWTATPEVPPGVHHLVCLCVHMCVLAYGLWTTSASIRQASLRVYDSDLWSCRPSRHHHKQRLNNLHTRPQMFDISNHLQSQLQNLRLAQGEIMYWQLSTGHQCMRNLNVEMLTESKPTSMSSCESKAGERESSLDAFRVLTDCRDEVQCFRMISATSVPRSTQEHQQAPGERICRQVHLFSWARGVPGLR